jgi:beta-alanine--pyruvate transaminase
MNKRADFTDLQESAFWMPFTSNRQFKKAPRLLARAEGMHYWTPEGRQILDACAGLWCVNAGHCRPKIVEAIQRQAAEMDFAPTFQMGHPIAFEFAERLAEIAPQGFKRVFFTNSGSESVDSALKIALAYHRARGEAGRFRLIGRERGYHGVNFGGISVGGLAHNRKVFGPGVAGVDHIRHTHDIARNAFSRGLPAHGAELAEDLERLCTLHDASTIAAVIVEPVPGSAGVLPPPRGYLERLREICTKHGILLIFDEVITGFGRLGQPFGSQKLGVLPDLFTTAKGMTNGAVPMGAVFVRDSIYEAFMKGPDGIELFHGYTYSGHPLACAAGIGALDTYEEEGLLERASTLEKHWEDAIHSLKGAPNVIDIRNFGLMGATLSE